MQRSAVLSRGAALSMLASVALLGCGRIGYPDDGPGGEAPDAAVPEVCADDEIVCGNFEVGIGGWIPRGNVGGGNRVEIVSAPVAVGTRSLFIHTDGTGDGFVAAEQFFAPVADGTLYGRALVWIGAITTVDDFLVTVQIDDGDDAGGQKISVDLLPGNALALTTTVPEPAIRPGSAEGAARRDDWMCMTFEIEVDAQRGAARFYLDDVLTVTIEDVDMLPEPVGFRRFMLAGVGPGPGISELGFDAVGVGREPLPCPAR